MQAILFVFISSEYLEYFFSSFNAQLNKAWQNNLIVLLEEKIGAGTTLVNTECKVSELRSAQILYFALFPQFFRCRNNKTLTNINGLGDKM